MAGPNEITIPEDLLLSDDLMPNDGSGFDVGDYVDDAAVASDKKVKIMVNGAAPMINMLLDWLNGDIAAVDSVDLLNLESKVDIEAQVLAAKRIKSNALVKIQTLVALCDAHGIKYSKKKAMKFMVDPEK